MEYKEIVSVSGKPGLFQMVAPRPDGLVAIALGESKKTFLSSRKHNFTLLENIGIYLISGETIELSSVFNAMTASNSERPTPKSDPDSLRMYFDEVIPDYDEDKVKLSDMKKILQWYTVLENHDLVGLIPSTSGDEEE